MPQSLQSLKAYNQIGTHSGINILGEVPWGSHLCELYDTEQDLLDVLVLYFMEGMANNELCCLVSANENESVRIYKGLKKSIAGINELITEKKIQLYLRDDIIKNSETDATNKFIDLLVGTQNKAFKNGFNGVRFAISMKDKSSKNLAPRFICDEGRLSDAIKDKRIITLCCIPIEENSASSVIGLLNCHEFAIIRQKGDWQMLEKSSLSISSNQFYKVNRELSQRVNEQTADLAQSLYSRDQFLAIASHELKTPISVLRLYVEGLLLFGRESDCLSENLILAFKKIQEQSINVECLINNLLDLTGFQKDGLISIQPHAMDLVALVRDQIKQINNKHKNALVTIHAPERILGNWDSLRLSQVINNLVENALKYSLNKPVIINLAQEGKRATIFVIDQGVGISKVNHEHIFECFIQLENKNATGGFGLGLWIVKRIVEAHEGKISVKSELNKGAEFIVSLPGCF